MHVDLTKKIKSSFFSVEKDTEEIVRKLFIENLKDHPAHVEALKRLLIINTEDCLDMNNQKYRELVNKMTIKDLFDKGYIRRKKKIKFPEHEEVKSYLIIDFGNWFPAATNPIEFRDCTVTITIICNSDYQELPNYALRYYKIAGYIDGILAESRLSGLGRLHFATADEITLNENESGLMIMYNAVHGSDDTIPPKDN